MWTISEILALLQLLVMILIAITHASWHLILHQVSLHRHGLIGDQYELRPS
ncbi:hypothetical protein DL98DRAFT_592040 [Cadophora sp. DSE1049]|nr:hypothetical protein DL98DRAFT_592040 [Cadophora sp. DSE1049]